MRLHPGSGEDSRVTDREAWRAHQRDWEKERLDPALEKSPERHDRFITQTGVEINRVYTPKDLNDPANDPDLDRPRSKPERIEWFLASMYCPCGVSGDTCTGDFYTLASCNPNACGMPHFMRQALSAKIDKGLTDRQIFEELLKEQGPDLVRQHLRP